MSGRGDTLYAHTGDIVLIPPFEPHRCDPQDVGNWSFVMVFVNDPSLRGACGGKMLTRVGERPSALFRDILSTVTDAGPGENERLLEPVRALLAECEPEGRLPRRGAVHPASDGVAAARDLLTKEFRHPPRLEEIASAHGYDPYRLIKEFRRRYGITPMAYAAQLRAAYAKRLVARGIPVVEVAYEAGYCDQAHLTRSFRANYGIGPARYARLMTSSILYKNEGETLR